MLMNTATATAVVVEVNMWGEITAWLDPGQSLPGLISIDSQDRDVYLGVQGDPYATVPLPGGGLMVDDRLLLQMGDNLTRTVGRVLTIPGVPYIVAVDNGGRDD